jgi:hypothetical protein
MRILFCVLLFAACNHDDDTNADGGWVDGANICDYSEGACHTLTCPVGQYCWVPWYTIPICGDPRDGGARCLEPQCGTMVPDGCLLENGHVVCPCQ